MAPYTAIGFFTCADEESKKTLLDAFAPVSAFVEKEEPFTTAYAFYNDMDDPLTMMAYEEWTSEENFKKHSESEAVKTFVGVVGPLAEAGKLQINQKFNSGGILAGFGPRVSNK